MKELQAKSRPFDFIIVNGAVLGLYLMAMAVVCGLACLVMTIVEIIIK